jgi:signal transduction histidine kinase
MIANTIQWGAPDNSLDRLQAQEPSGEEVAPRGAPRAHLRWRPSATIQLEEPGEDEESIEERQETRPWDVEGDPFSLFGIVSESLRFESLLLDLSVRFVHLSVEEVDGHIESALESIALLLGAERCTLFEYAPARNLLQARHSWASSGSGSVSLVASQDYPYVCARILQGESVWFSSLDELPEEAALDREQLAEAGIRSFIGVPLRLGGAGIGGIWVASYRAEQRWSETVASRLLLLGGILTAALARKRDQEEMQRLRDELAHVARIVTLGAVATSIAHEVNQPLCAILSNAQSTMRMLANDRTPRQTLSEAMEDIASDAKRASEVVGRIRSLGKRGALRRAPISLNDLIREVMPLVRDELLCKEVAVSLELAEALPRICGDRVQLQQVILNLIVNSCEALERVEVGARSLTLRTCRDESGMVTLQVKDSGPGLDPAAIERVFDAFFTTKPTGMGLGLAISRSIIKAHRGRLWASPNTGPGTTFYVALPALREDGYNG